MVLDEDTLSPTRGGKWSTPLMMLPAHFMSFLLSCFTSFTMLSVSVLLQTVPYTGHRESECL
ncbi:hypothetical protein M378DRAFT_163024 [Amanita muscaria Koide BX008]|uniref:Uncharacterized protein n=1 Tax=Amanita muscaria (strain Koide BX008) TaxID=946122 RepID=A0A0C2X5N8_AMAMK|nr:hypothetical protein M378DRAFT_163024 [Amanita muscaria Koide BX008]